MTHTPTPPNCPDCGEPLPVDSPQALCPACLMRQALASRTIIQEGEKRFACPPPSPEEIADKFPLFEILECLGRGGMGVVYKARQKSLNRLVAIKILAPEREHEPQFADRFAREAELLAKLNHPHIVTIHDFGETGGLFYLVMEFVDGVNLRDLLRDGKLESKQALAIVPPICEALQYAHEKGIVHRDIKPENLLLDKEGRIKIADFGIAGLIGAGGENIGTPPYMAPEQSGDSTEVDSRADIYALGVVLYEMLTGERPAKDLVAPSKKVQIDVRLDEMVLRALEKSPELRYQTAGEFRTVLETMMGEEPTTATPRQSQLLRSGESLYATPEFLATLWGAMKLHQGMGALLLFSDRLEFQTGLIRTVIPLNSLRRMDLVNYPFFQSPAGLRSIELEFLDAGTPRRLVLTPSRGLFAFVGTTNNRVFEWFGAIREAVKQATGSPPAGSSSPIPYQGFSSDGKLVSAVIMLASFMTLLGILTITAVTGSWRNLFPLAVPFILGVFFVLALAWRQRRQWLSEHPLPVVHHVDSPPESPKSPPPRGMFRRWWWLFLAMIPVGVALGLVAGTMIHYVIPKKYEAQAIIEVKPPAGNQITPRFFATEFERLQSRKTLAEVSNRMELENRWMLQEHKVIPLLKSIITVQNIRGTDLIDITVRHTNAGDATEIANTLTAIHRDSSGNQVFIHQTAIVPSQPVSPNTWLLFLLAALTGLIISPLLALSAMAILQRLIPEQRTEMGVAGGPGTASLPGTAVFTVIAVVSMLLLAASGNAMVMMIGAGVVLAAGLLWFTKRNIRLALLVTLASLGVAGGVVLLIQRKQIESPAPSVAAEFGPVIEILLPDPTANTGCVVDFESGELLEPPANIVPVLNHDVSKLPPAALRWLRDHSADAVLAPDGSVRLIEGVVFNPTRQGKALTWDDFTPDNTVSFTRDMNEEQRRASTNQPAFHFVTLREPAALPFTTRERSYGVLQILGASDNPHGLRIRYKLVKKPVISPPLPPGYEQGKGPPRPPDYEGDRNAAPRPAASVAVGSPEMAFGPVIERVLSENDSLSNCFLDAETGHVLSAPRQFVEDLKSKRQLDQGNTQLMNLADWVRVNRVDFVLQYQNPDTSLRLLEGFTIASTTPFELCEAATVVQYANEIQSTMAPQVQPGFHMSCQLSAPGVNCWIFRTREGNAGVLQITAVKNKPGDVCVRYKLVKNGPPAVRLNGIGAASLPKAAQTKPRITLKPIPPEALRAVEEYARFHQSTTPRDLGLSEVREKMNALDRRWKDALKGTVCQLLLDEMDSLSREREVAEHAGNAAESQRLAREIQTLGDKLTDLLTEAGMKWPGLESFSLRWVAREGDWDTLKLPEAGNVNGQIRVMKNALLDTSVIETVGWSKWNGGSKELFLTLKDEASILTLQQETSKRIGDRLAVVWQGQVIGVFEVKKPLSNGLHIPLDIPDGIAFMLGQELKLAVKGSAEVKSDKVLVEDLALHMIVAIREKDDAKLKSLATDRIKGWPDALPVAAVELREHFRQFTGNDKFDLKAEESLVEGELAVVRCTGPAALQGKCLVFFFVKTKDGWRNHSLRNSSESTPLANHLAELKK